MNTKLLKQRILDLAIHGRLVPQNPDDEPASQLLRRISEEKEKLIAQGKIKRPKKSDAPNSAQEFPFEIPDNWEWVRLGDIFSMQAGKNISSNEIHTEKSNDYPYPCYGGNGIRGYVQNYNVDGNFVIIGRQGALCGNVQMASGLFYATEHAVVTYSYAKTDIKWVYYFLTELNLNQYATATAQPGLAVSKILEVFIPLPPLAEQRRIVSAIEKWFSLIDEIETNKESLQAAIKQTKSKVLDLAIKGKLVKKTAEWKTVTLGEIAEVINGKSQKKVEDANGEYPIYGSGGIIGRANSYLCPENCTIIGRKGTINNPIFVNTKFWNVDTAFGMQPSQKVDCKFFYYFCKSFNFAALDTSTAVPSLTKTKIQQILFPLPPLSEQTRIVSKIEEVFALLDEIERELA